MTISGLMGRSDMKFKYFALICIIFFVLSVYLAVFERDQPIIVGIVTETHRSFKNFQKGLKDEAEKVLNVDEKYMVQLGFKDNPRLFPMHYIPNITLPVVVTYVKDSHEDQSVSFVRNIMNLLPDYLIILYNIGLKPYELFLLQNFCSTHHCVLINFNLNLFPAHVINDDAAFRPLIIQDALRRFGGIFFMESNVRLLTGNLTNFFEMAKEKGILAWQSNFPASAITHPKMFEYLKLSSENFYFVPAVKSTKLVIYNTALIHYKLMYPWIKCVLVRNCILPLGSQDEGCQYFKKPLYRYSGCHMKDQSALSIILGQIFNYSFRLYSCEDNSIFRNFTADDAKLEISLLIDNGTDTLYNID